MSPTCSRSGWVSSARTPLIQPGTCFRAITWRRSTRADRSPEGADAVQFDFADWEAVQPGSDAPVYLPATPETVRWGRLFCGADAPVLTVESGTAVTIDTVSHEG